MSPDIVIDRLRCFLRRNVGRIDSLDEEHPPIEAPVCYKRGQEFWILPKTWRDVFADDYGWYAPKILSRLGLLRLPKGMWHFQITVRVRGRRMKAYAVNVGILRGRLRFSRG
jgi:hypothetical protein